MWTGLMNVRGILSLKGICKHQPVVWTSLSAFAFSRLYCICRSCRTHPSRQCGRRRRIRHEFQLQRTSAISRRAQDMAPQCRQDARENREDKKTSIRRKRKHEELLSFSESTSEYSCTHSDESDCGSGSCGSSYDDSSSSIDEESEYYYSRSQYEDTYSDNGSSSYSSSRASTQYGYPLHACNQKGAGKCYPEYNPKILGKGHFAVVYLSYSEYAKKYFAIKSACRPSACKSLTREADILKQLDSPYIIEYLGERRVPIARKALTSATQPKLVPMVTEIYLPYMKRGTLGDEIRVCFQKKHVMNERVIHNYTKQILLGLNYLHSKNIVHCDIKGSNILVGNPYLKISDFGVSKDAGKTPSDRRGSISRAGTRAWMAPEVHMRIEQGFPSDIWSFGCTVVQMITGNPPVTLEVKSFLQCEIHNEQPYVHRIPNDFKRISSECIDFLRKCFLKDPEARWTCEQLLDHPFLKGN